MSSGDCTFVGKNIGKGECVMITESTWLTRLLNQITEFLQSIQYESCFILGILALLATACFVRLVRMIMIMVSPNGYSKDNNKAIGILSHIAYWFAIVFTVPVWFFGSSDHLLVLQFAHKMSGIIHLGLMLLTLLLAGLNMLIGKKGKRVFIAKAMCRSSIILAVEGAILLLIGYFLIP